MLYDAHGRSIKTKFDKSMEQMIDLMNKRYTKIVTEDLRKGMEFSAEMKIWELQDSIKGKYAQTGS